MISETVTLRKGTGWSNCGGTNIQESFDASSERNWRPRREWWWPRALNRKAHHGLIYPFKSASHAWWKCCRHPLCRPVAAGRSDEKGVCEVAVDCVLWPNSEPGSLESFCFKAVPARGSCHSHGQRQVNYLCFLSAGGNGSNTCEISSINKCWGLIAWSALAREAVGPPVSSVSGHGCPGCRKPQVFCLQRRVGFSACRGELRWPSSIFIVEKCLLCTNWSPSWQPPMTAPILGGEAEFCVERREGDRWPWSRAENSWITALIILEPSHQVMGPRIGNCCPQNHTGSI